MHHKADSDHMRPFRPFEDFLTINVKGHLVIDGFDTVDLAAKYGTPVYLISEDRIRKNFRTWLNAFQSRYERTRIFYALKANPSLREGLLEFDFKEIDLVRRSGKCSG